MPLCAATAMRTSAAASAAPEASPSRRPRSSRGSRESAFSNRRCPGSAERCVEQPSGGVLAGIEVRPALAHLHQALAHRIRDLGPVDDRASRQHVDLDAALRHRLDARGELLEQLLVRAARAHVRLHLQVEVLRIRDSRYRQRQGARRECELCCLQGRLHFHVRFVLSCVVMSCAHGPTSRPSSLAHPPARISGDVPEPGSGREYTRTAHRAFRPFRARRAWRAER